MTLRKKTIDTKCIRCDIVLYTYTSIMTEGGMGRSVSIAIDVVITVVRVMCNSSTYYKCDD